MTANQQARLAIATALMLAVPAAAAATPPIADFTAFRYEGHQPVYARVHAGPGEYLNPILEGFRPDPSITRQGDDYYLATSSFAYFPGIPIFRSRDLISWTQVGAAISRPTQLNFDRLGVSRGVFAPDIKMHDGRFYLLNTCVDCGGNFLLTATDPVGPWSDPVWLAFDGIDPSIFFDDDGRAYVINNGPPKGAPLYEGHRAIWLQELDLHTLKLVGPRTVLVNGGVDITKHPSWIEGPHLLKHDGRYVLIAAQGGTGDQHSEVAFRADTVRGPFRPDPNNPILTQRGLDPHRPDPITSTGHADFVTTPSGETWAVFLGTRPYADDLYNTGRETFLLPVRWRDGWPRITEAGQGASYVARRPDLPAAPPSDPPTSGDFVLSDSFITPTLSPFWTWLRTPRAQWWRTGEGRLTIKARPESLGGEGQPSFVAVRQSHMNATASVHLRFAPQEEGDRAGLAAFQDDAHYFLLAIEGVGAGRKVSLERRMAMGEPADGVAVASAPLSDTPDAPVGLKLMARGGRYGFFYAAKGAWRQLGDWQDGTALSTHKAGGFTGVMLGLYAYAGPDRSVATRNGAGAPRLTGSGSANFKP